MQNLGTGVLNWNGSERRSDRYGSVALTPSPDSVQRIPFVAEGGAHGRLIAVVQETRQSRHIGDLCHGVQPTTPEVGERITLGEGTLFFTDDHAVGIRPDDGRDTLWLDIHALYRVHEQTVALYFDSIPLN